jgi:hypothetical protein
MDSNYPIGIFKLFLLSSRIQLKYFSSNIKSNLMKLFESHNILSDKQHGFRKKRLCESQLILTIQDLAAGLNSKIRLMPFYSISVRHLIKSHTRDWQWSYITMESVVTPCHGLKFLGKQRPAGNIRLSQIQLSTSIIRCTSGDSTWPTAVPGLH